MTFSGNQLALHQGGEVGFFESQPGTPHFFALKYDFALPDSVFGQLNISNTITNPRVPNTDSIYRPYPFMYDSISKTVTIRMPVVGQK
jgi:hypothetical protein